MKIEATGILNKSKSGDILDVFYPSIDFDGKKTDSYNFKNLDTNKEIVELVWSEKDLDSSIKDLSLIHI